MPRLNRCRSVTDIGKACGNTRKALQVVSNCGQFRVTWLGGASRLYRARVSFRQSVKCEMTDRAGVLQHATEAIMSCSMMGSFAQGV